MKKFVCKVCGYIYEGDAAPAECPVCHAKSNMFEEVKGELTLAAEHEYGVYAKTVKNNPDVSEADKQYIFDQLKANFNGECSEVGMYLCMARIAHREGYPDGTAAAYPATHPTHPSARPACDPHGRTMDETVQPSLTQREIDVLRLVVAGLLNKQIAQRLDVALTTVISHRRNLVRKLGIRSVAGLTIYAGTKGYVDAEQLGEQ